MTQPQRGRGRARIARPRTVDKKPGKLGSTGSSTSTASSASVQVLRSFHNNIPASAKLPLDEVLWVNNKGQQKPRQVVGDKVMLRQQPAALPQSPEVLLLTDQTLQEFQSPDKYIKCISLMGYALPDFTNDIRDGMIDVNYKYVIVHLATLQIAQYSHAYVRKIVSDLVSIITEISPNTLIMMLGLVPRPLDHHRSKGLCASYSKSYAMVTEEIRKNKGWNCVTLDVFSEFLDGQGEICQEEERFFDGLFLTPTGIRILRAAWLRRLRYFPMKASRLSVGTAKSK